jgi:hypothetical protein
MGPRTRHAAVAGAVGHADRPDRGRAQDTRVPGPPEEGQNGSVSALVGEGRVPQRPRDRKRTRPLVACAAPLVVRYVTDSARRQAASGRVVVSPERPVRLPSGVHLSTPAARLVTRFGIAPLLDPHPSHRRPGTRAPLPSRPEHPYPAGLEGALAAPRTVGRRTPSTTHRGGRGFRRRRPRNVEMDTSGTRSTADPAHVELGRHRHTYG